MVRPTFLIRWRTDVDVDVDVVVVDCFMFMFMYLRDGINVTSSSLLSPLLLFLLANRMDV